MDTSPTMRWIGRAHRILAVATGCLLLAMVLLNVVNVIARRLFAAAIPEADELMVFSMVWLVFLGVILVTAEDRHLRFDILSKALRGRGSLVHGIVLDALVAVLAAYVAVQSYDVVGRLLRFDQRSMAAGIPMAVPHLAVLVGLAATALVAAGRVVLRTVRLLGGGGEAER